jgi:hypothetical protein
MLTSRRRRPVDSGLVRPTSGDYRAAFGGVKREIFGGRFDGSMVEKREDVFLLGFAVCSLVVWLSRCYSDG